MAGVTFKHKYKDHLSNNYGSLANYVGEPLQYISGLKVYAKPDGARLIADYKNTILVELMFLGNVWNPHATKPRYIRHMIPKASLATGEVKFVCESNGEPLFGEIISGRISEEEAFIW